MPNVIKTCAKCGCRYEYFFDGQNFLPCPNCGDDPIGSLERASTIDLITKLRSSDRSTLNNAAVMLGERRVQEAAEPLLAILCNDRDKVEDGVIIALGLLREERAVKTLVSRLMTEQYPGRIIEALLRIGTDQALEAVLATNAFNFSPGTLRALGKFRHEKVANALSKVALVERINPETEIAAIMSLGEVGGELAITTLRSKLFSRNQSIATVASDALMKLGFAEPFFGRQEEFEAAKITHLLSTDAGDADSVKTIIAARADVNTKDSQGRSVLIKAATKGGAESVRALITAGAEVNAKDYDGLTALMNAAAIGDADSIKALIASGADVNARSKFGSTALIKAADKGHSDCVSTLIAAGADVNAIDDLGSTALMKVAEKGDANNVKALIAAGADVKSNNGIEALKHAAKEGYMDCIKALIAAGVDVKGSNGIEALKDAAMKGHTESVKALVAAGTDVNAKSKYYGTVLMDAADFGDEDSVKFLIAAGADVNAKATRGETALWYAANKGHTEIINALIAAGADMKDNKGASALYWAVCRGHTESVKALIAAGADVNEGRNTVNSVLKKAIDGYYREIVAALVAAGAKN